MEKSAKVYIPGHTGMVGSALLRNLRSKGFTNILTRSSKDLDLRCQKSVSDFFENERPDFVFLSAAKVGGIYANSKFRAEFIYDNLMIEANIINSAYLFNVKKLLFLGSSCIYPKFANQPLKEEYLMSGYLEPTNQPYAIAKIAGIELCDSYRSQYGCNFISAMPTNLYGSNDNFHPENSHVIPSLIRKFIEAKRNNSVSVEIWGSGLPMREFLHVDDLAEACYFLMEGYNEPGIINIGTGVDISVRDLALMIKDIVGFNGDLIFDIGKPDGTMKKLLDVSRIHEIGWQHKIDLKQGISLVCHELENHIFN
jgi:GDP-L-fucose synthase